MPAPRCAQCAATSAIIILNRTFDYKRALGQLARWRWRCLTRRRRLGRLECVHELPTECVEICLSCSGPSPLHHRPAGSLSLSLIVELRHGLFPRINSAQTARENASAAAQQKHTQNTQPTEATNQQNTPPPQPPPRWSCRRRRHLPGVPERTTCGNVSARCGLWHARLGPQGSSGAGAGADARVSGVGYACECVRARARDPRRRASRRAACS